MHIEKSEEKLCIKNWKAESKSVVAGLTFPLVASITKFLAFYRLKFNEAPQFLELVFQNGIERRKDDSTKLFNLALRKIPFSLNAVLKVL